MTVIKDDRNEFQNVRIGNISALSKDASLARQSNDWTVKAFHNHYTYNFDWLGVPIIQLPQDIVAIQELIWKTKPDIIVETGIARGGSLILSASMLHLLNGDGKVIGVDIDIRPHNRETIESHPLASRIRLVEGSSIDESTLGQVKSHISAGKKVMVILDSNHTYDHVKKEIEMYAPLVSAGCYLLVMDTIVEDMPEDFYHDRPWGKGNNPKTAVHEFLKTTDRFEIDKNIQNKLLLTVAPDGYLKCIK
jgi:cephalosporin hydroxylase